MEKPVFMQPLLGYHSCSIGFLTSRRDPAVGQCQAGSLKPNPARDVYKRQVEKDVGFQRQPGCWLRSSHTLKECVIAHWSSDFARKI